MASKSKHPAKKTKVQKTITRPSTGTLKGSERAIATTTMALMGFAILLVSWFYFLTLPMLIMVILDVLVLTETIKDETYKRLVLLFSILGAAVAAYILWFYYSLFTGGLTF